SERIASSASCRTYASIFCMSVPSLGRDRPERRHRRCRRCRRAAVGCQDIWLGRAVTGQELLGIAPHPVLVDVEALELLLRADAQADGLLAEVEDRGARG